MSRACPPSHVIVAVLVGDEPAAEFNEHQRRCRRCAAIATAVGDAVAAGLVEDDVDVETLIAEEIISALDEQPDHRWWSIVRDDPAFHAAFVAKHLLDVADRFYGRDPRRGLAYVEAALVICEATPKIPAAVHATALKEKSTYLRRFFRIGEALATLDVADKVAATAGDDAKYISATLKLARAMILADPEVGQFDDALRLAAEARVVLAGLDRGRELTTMRVTAMVTMWQGHFAEALNAFEALLPLTLEAETPDLDLATLYQAIGKCAAEIGDIHSALQAMALARVIFEQLGSLADLAKCDWIDGRAGLHASSYENSLALFESAAEAFERLGRWDLWVRVKLDSVHALLSANPATDVVQRCESIATMSTMLDQREPNRRRHCTAEALDFLRRYAGQGALDIETVKYVRSYLDEIAERPPRSFLAPTHPNIM
jgi:tetratricopeptide (TPR) repeat protein